MQLHTVFLLFFVAMAVLTAFSWDILRSAISLLLCSLGLTLILFNLNAPLAGVFELSVCTGLITVLFINTISLVPTVTGETRIPRAKRHHRKFRFLPFLVILIIGALWFSRDFWLTNLTVQRVQETVTTGQVLWGQRGIDLIGQIIMILVGIYGVVLLFKRGKMNE